MKKLIYSIFSLTFLLAVSANAQVRLNVCESKVSSETYKDIHSEQYLILRTGLTCVSPHGQCQQLQHEEIQPSQTNFGSNTIVDRIETLQEGERKFYRGSLYQCGGPLPESKPLLTHPLYQNHQILNADQKISSSIQTRTEKEISLSTGQIVETGLFLNNSQIPGEFGWPVKVSCNTDSPTQFGSIKLQLKQTLILNFGQVIVLCK